jgi:peptide/nickel transport system permease protein
VTRRGGLIGAVAAVACAAWLVGGDPGALVGTSLQAPLSMVAAPASPPPGTAPGARAADDMRRAWLGTDPIGRDVFVRVVHGGRLSILLAASATLLALFLGGLVGAGAGAVGGLVDAVLMRLSELVMVLPALYVLLAVRASLPLVVSPVLLFAVTAVVLGTIGAPLVARATRAVVASERSRDFVQAAIGTGASPWRILLRHLVPQAAPVLVAQALVLFPAFLLAEATMSFAGLGFPGDRPSWGTLLQDAASVRALDTAPWLLAPVVAMALTVWAVNVLADDATAGER